MENLLKPDTRVGQHAMALGAFAVGTVAGLVDLPLPIEGVFRDWHGLQWGFAKLMSTAWCSLAIVWFPFAAVAILRRMKVERVALGAAMVSLFVGYDGVIRLLYGAYESRGGC